MRGGRFQRKTTEDASLRNAEALFESRSVVDIREVEAKTRREIDEKKEELRQLIGASYRDLIDSADSIVCMQKLCENVAENIHSMERGFDMLKHGIWTPPAVPGIDKEKQKKEKLYGIGSRVKYIVDTPEKIWGCLDEHMYLEGAQRYFRAREVQSILMKDDGVTDRRDLANISDIDRRDLLIQFPLLRHQWSLVKTFHGQISQRSRERLLEFGLDVHEYAVALAAVAVIDELNSQQILSLFFETRRAWLRAHLRTAAVLWDKGMRNGAGEYAREGLNKNTGCVNSDVVGKRGLNGAFEGGKGNGNISFDADAVAVVFYRAANMIQISLCQAGQLFLEVNGDQPLFFGTVLNSPPGSQLFGGIPNPEKEAQLWKHHWEKLESQMSPLPGQLISDACMSWIRACQSDMNAEGKLIMNTVVHGKDLAMIENIIKDECHSRKTLKQSLEWLENAFGKSIDVPWNYVTALILKEPFDLWNMLFENMFLEKAKGIIGFELLKLDMEEMLNTLLASTSTTKTLNQASIGPMSGEMHERFLQNDWFEISMSYLGPEVLQLKNVVDKRLQGVLEDCIDFLAGNSARSKELFPFLQKQCFSWMSDVINKLLTRVLDLEDCLSQHLHSCDKVSGSSKSHEFAESESIDASSSVENALFLGRVLMAFSELSWVLPAILHPVNSLKSKDESAKKASLLQRLVTLQSSSMWMNTDPDLQAIQSTRVGSHIRSLQTVGSSLSFKELQLALRYSSLLAHSIWVSWMSHNLSAALVRELLKDGDLTSQVPLKGWEDTVLRQLNENGDEIEVHLPLPTMPSSYVISFLFKSCWDIYHTGGHTLDRAVLQLFACRLFEKVMTVYNDFYLRLQTPRSNVSEIGLLQVMFDLHFLGDVLSGGQNLTLDFNQFLKDELILSHVFSTSTLSRVKELLIEMNVSGKEQNKWLDSLQEKFSRLLDPINWATYEPHLWENEQQFYQRCSILFGFLNQLNHLYKDAPQRLPSMSTEANVLRVSLAVPRFTYLPISTPSMVKKSVNVESRSITSTVTSNERTSKLMLEDESSFVSATPLFKSLMNQVGSRFGEGTFRFGSMLTDGQVSRLKDRSAAAFSTIGEILPSQAAGLLSSLTVGTGRSESS